MGVVRTITRNVLSNFAGYFVSVIVGFLLTPYVIEQIGVARWGLWQIVIAFTGSYGLLDLGIRSAVGHYVTRYWAQSDLDGVNRTIATSLMITGCVGAFLVVVTGLLAFSAPLLFDDGVENIAEMRLVILIMGVGVALNFPLAVFRSATYARQRFDIGNAVGISERLVSAGLYVWVLEKGWDLVGIAAVSAIVPTLANVLRIFIAYRLLPGLAVARGWIQRSSIRELFSFGFYNVLVNASDMIVLHSDAIIIGIVFDPDAVGYYCAGSFVIYQSIALINSIAWTLTPHANACDTRGDVEALRRLWMTGTRVIVMMGALIAGGMVLLGGDFLSLWLDGPEGQAMVQGVQYTSSVTIMAILAGTVFVRAAMACGKQILFGVQEVRFLAKNSFATAGLNVLLSIAMIYVFGLIGVAVASVIAFSVMQLWFQPRFLASRIEKPFSDIMIATAWIPCAVVGTMWGVEWVVRDYISAATWSGFVWKSTVVCVPALLAGAQFGLSHVEKDKVRAFVRRAIGGRNPFTGRTK